MAVRGESYDEGDSSNTPDVDAGKIDIGYPDSNGDHWQFNVRAAEALDVAGVEIIEVDGQPFDGGQR